MKHQRSAQCLRKSPNRNPYRPGLEQLEDRFLLATFLVDSTADDSDFNPGDGTCSTSATGGACTLRAALEEANQLANSPAGTPDEIHFAIAGTGVHTITPASALPTITEPVIIDGYTQDSGTADPADDAKPNAL